MSRIIKYEPEPEETPEAAGGRETEIVLNYSRAYDIASVNESYDFVEGLLCKGGTSIFYGPSNVAKSFLAFDLAAAVATGRPFAGELETEQGAVLYLCLEGGLGTCNRLDALKRKGLIGEDTPLFVSFDHLNFSTPKEAETLSYGEIVAHTVREIEKAEGLPLRLVIVDTLSRAMAGGDENSGRDMMVCVNELDAIKGTSEAHVMIVHHSGKDEGRGARGHSSLKAAVDTEVELSRNSAGTITTMKVTKQRDLPIRNPMPFSLEVIELGTDRRGNPITSCTVKHEDELMAEVKDKGGRPAANSLSDILSLLPQPSTTAWQKAAKAERGIASSTFYELRKLAESSGAAISTKSKGWKIPEVRFAELDLQQTQGIPALTPETPET